ncbi:hypothetical protein D9615_007336 [Tricholomella constricta]|uniref:F-box domain-containing protein n=1 Tax=Tricholomella constricta TaxID=117010 RepID=A0A8H5M107_9AGAR|nr:hypothetical protein D9615_007336 [Tricholomella constricta]
MSPRETQVANAYYRINIRPTSTEIEVLDSAIRNAVDKISHYDRERFSLQLKVNAMLHELQYLSTKGTQMRQERDNLVAIRSSARLLPTEILVHIFAYLGVDGNFHSPEMSMLLNICRVCSAWRNACIGCPELWTAVSIDIPGTDADLLEVQSARKLFALWFDRARYLPIRFSLKVFKDEHDPSKELLREILPFVHRISELQICLERPHGLDSLSPVPRASMSMLERLSLSFPRGHHHRLPYSATYPIRFFDAAPLLRAVSLDLDSITLSNSAEFACPWSQLTYLEIKHGVQPAAWDTILRQCLNLQSGAFHLIEATFHYPFQLGPTRVTYETLTALTLNLSPHIRQETAMPYQCFDFPALQDLCLIADVPDVVTSRSDDLDGSANINTFLPCLTASSLRRLVLVRVSVKFKDLVRFLATCTDLEELSLDLPELPHRKLFTALQYGVEGMIAGPSLPQLTSFATCIPSGDDSLSATSRLADLVLWWHLHCPRRIQPLKDVTLFAYHAPRRNSDHIDSTADVLRAFESAVEHCVYDEVSCPTGFRLKTVIASDVKQSPLKGLRSWTSLDWQQ